MRTFGEEWRKFGDLGPQDLAVAGTELFDLLGDAHLPERAVMLDIGCGNGRWSRYLAPRMEHIDAIDPSDSVLAAAGRHSPGAPIRWSRAIAEDLPFANDTFDLGICIGVLHHLQDPASALREAYRVLRPGGGLYLYMYYSLEQRGPVYRALYAASDTIRRVVHRFPGPIKRAASELLAVLLYLPLVGLARLARAVGYPGWRGLPLAYYHNKSFRVMRNDALDRFGTSYETRHTRKGISDLLTAAGFGAIRFSEQAPFWHCIARKPGAAK